MTRPLFYAGAGELDGLRPGASFVLAGGEGRHAVSVRRMRAGEGVLIADTRGVRADGVVTAASGGELTVVIESVVAEPRPVPAFTLVQALAKGERDERAIETATEYGVDAIVPWQAHRSIVQWRGERGEKSRRKWQDVAYAAAKQSRRAWVPEVAPIVTTTELLDRVRGAAAAYVLHEEASEPLAGQAIPASGEVLVVVGPEGGIAAEEVESLRGAGGIPVRLGEQVLRSSSAGPAAIAVLSAGGRWR